MRRIIVSVAVAAAVLTGCGGSADGGDGDVAAEPGDGTTTEATGSEAGGDASSEAGTATGTTGTAGGATPDLGRDVLRTPTEKATFGQRLGPDDRPRGTTSPAVEPARIDDGVRSTADRAARDLARRMEAEPGSVEVVSAVAVEWPDAGLGCPVPGMSYAQVMVEGSLVELRHDGRIYRYHAGQDAEPFPCDQPLPTTPRITSS